MAALGWIEIFVILIVGILLVVGVSSLIRRGRGQERSQPTRPQSLPRAIEEPPAASPVVRRRLAPSFKDVERQVEALRRQVADGLLSEEECKARMRDLMVEDADGTWWMVGYETGEWYRHDGTDWVPSDPPLAHGVE